MSAFHQIAKFGTDGSRPECAVQILLNERLLAAEAAGQVIQTAKLGAGPFDVKSARIALSDPITGSTLAAQRRDLDNVCCRSARARYLI
jgi:hypothetical protein